MMKICFQKYTFLTLFFCVFCNLVSLGQDNNNRFIGYLYNDEYQVFLKMNFRDNNIVVDGQEVFGEVPGYFGAIRDTRKWLITGAKKKGQNVYSLGITNDYGSEDLSATLRYNGNGTYTLKQMSGSRIKIVVNRKWVKIPSELIFTCNDIHK